MKARDTFILLTLSVLSAEGQTFQKAFDAANTSSGIVEEVHSTTDGGYLVTMATDTERVQWKADANGNALWSKRYAVRHTASARMPDGGLVTVTVGATTRTNHDFDIDTALFHYSLTRTDLNGAYEWRKEVVMSWVAPHNALLSVSIGAAQISTDDAGRVFVEAGIDNADEIGRAHV